MTASELLTALEGVPDEALPPQWRHWLREARTAADYQYDTHAANGAMLAWLADRAPTVSTNELRSIYAISFMDKGGELTDRDGPTLTHALAAACKAVNKESKP